MCTNDLILLHPLAIFSFSFSFFSEKNPVCRDRTHGPTCQTVTWLPLSYRGDRLVGVLNLHLDNTAVQNILSDRMLRIKGSAEHSRWTCVDRPSCSVDEKLHNNAPHRKCLRKRRLPASACLFSLESSMALSKCCFQIAVQQGLTTERLPCSTLHEQNLVFKSPCSRPYLPVAGLARSASQVLSPRDPRHTFLVSIMQALCVRKCWLNKKLCTLTNHNTTSGELCICTACAI